LALTAGRYALDRAAVLNAATEKWMICCMTRSDVGYSVANAGGAETGFG